VLAINRFSAQLTYPSRDALHTTGNPRLGDDSYREVAPHLAPNVRCSGARRIVRSEYIQSSSLNPEQRRSLYGQLYEVYSDTVSGLTYQDLERLVFASDGRIALYYGADDELAGFSFARIERIEHEGRSHAVFCAGVLFRLGYRGGIPASFFGLRQALRFKLREPRTPLAYMTRSSSPAVYRLLASTMPQVYPSCKHETPAQVESLVRAYCGRWHYEPVGENAWIQRSPAMPHNPSRLRRLETDPYARFYMELNPNWASGESLLTWIPLTVANIAGGLLRLVRSGLSR
jgi:hypothetical protein